MKLTDLELKQIEQCVKAVEQRTRGEIVPLVLSSSREYPEAWLILSLSGMAAFGGASLLVHEVLGAGWSLTLPRFATELVAGAVVGLLAGMIPALRRFAVGKEDLAEAVDLRAAAEFTRLGVMNTGDRCGVLLLVSLFEHRIEIVADRGIHSQVGEGYWQAELDRMMAELRTQGLVPALCAGITRMGDQLAEKFPREAGTVNELPDQLRRGD